MRITGELSEFRFIGFHKWLMFVGSYENWRECKGIGRELLGI